MLGLPSKFTARYLLGRAIAAAVMAAVFVASEYAFGATGQELLDNGHWVLQSTQYLGSPPLTINGSAQDVIDQANSDLLSGDSGTCYNSAAKPFVITAGQGTTTVAANSATVKIATVRFDYCHQQDGQSNFTDQYFYTAESEPESCEAGIEKRTSLDFYAHEDDPISTLPEYLYNADGCEFHREGIQVCTGAADNADGSPGVQCLVRYVSTGEDGQGPNSADRDLGLEPVETPYDQPTTTDTVTDAPDVTEYSDGSSRTVESTTTVTEGGAHLGGGASGGGHGFNIVGTATNTTTNTITTFDYADGSQQITEVSANSWSDGKGYTVNISQGGAINITSIDGATGGGSTTTTTTVNADGSSTTESTSKGNGGESGGGGSSCEGGKCDQGDGDGDGEGEGGSGPPGEYAGDGAPSLDDDIPTIGESFTTLYDGIAAAPVLVPLSGLGDGVPTGGTCPTASFSVLDTQYTIDAHCQLADAARPTLEAVFRVVWAIAALMLLFTA